MRMGILDGVEFMAHAAHLTLDGEYIISYDMDKNWYLPTNQQKLGNTYPSHQAWCNTGTEWYTIPVAGIAFSRWDSIAAANVPECVRMAEMLR